LLANPNCEFPVNYVPLRTLAEFAACAGPWDARAAYLAALREWWPRFATASQPLNWDDFVALGDCFYLPHEDGPEAQALYDSAVALLAKDASEWEDHALAFQQQATRLRDCCARVADLRDRPLFHALWRRTWELREELDLLLGYVRLRTQGRNPEAPCRSDFHLPGTYRGGLVARLQRLLIQQPDGTFTPGSHDPP
jgi:protein O-GlcNAcase/histone acetyltransferase